MALTGRSSPAGHDFGRDVLHETPGASAGPRAACELAGGLGGNLDLLQGGHGAVDGAKFILTTFSPLLAVGLLDGLLEGSMASSCGSTPEMLKKQVCMIVLMRAPSPSSWASLMASIT
jgi:hypothetical protein